MEKKGGGGIVPHSNLKLFLMFGPKKSKNYLLTKDDAQDAINDYLLSYSLLIPLPFI